MSSCWALYTALRARRMFVMPPPGTAVLIAVWISALKQCAPEPTRTSASAALAEVASNNALSAAIYNETRNMVIPFFGESVLDPYRQSTRLCGRNRHAVWLELRRCEPEPGNPPPWTAFLLPGA